MALTRVMFLAAVLAGTSCLQHDPDVDLTAPQIIRRHGYPSESHVVATRDGYLLTLHRIPHGVNTTQGTAGTLGSQDRALRPPVFLQHGMLSSSADWILNGPEKSLAFLLADSGFDVWLGNARGNTYSRAHTEWSTADSRFWNFTWHEMARYDLPAELDYVLEQSGQRRLFYIGHSMGTTMFFALASTQPEYNDKVQAMIGLAPVAYVGHMKSPIRLIAPWADDVEFIAHYLGADAFLPQNKMVQLWARYGCLALQVEEDICQNVMFILCGYDKAQFNMTMLPLILAHTPAGASTKTLIHYAQEISSGKFQQFDYGPGGNQAMYNSTKPPEYNITQITAPVALFNGDNDWLASELDVNLLFEQLPNTIGKFLVPFKGFNHLDFLWAIDAKTLVYDDVIKHLTNYSDIEK